MELSAAELIAMLGEAIYDPCFGLDQSAQVVSSNAMLLFLILAGISQILFITPYWNFTSIDGKTCSFIRPTGLMFLLFGLTCIAYLVRPIRLVVGLIAFPPAWTLIIICTGIIWFFVARYALRKRLFSSLADITMNWYNKRLSKEYADERS